jgi:hypothetical protein
MGRKVGAYDLMKRSDVVGRNEFGTNWTFSRAGIRKERDRF